MKELFPRPVESTSIKIVRNNLKEELNYNNNLNEVEPEVPSERRLEE